MTHDTLQRFIFENDPVRGEYIKLVESYQTILQQHNYPEIIRDVLGEALCIAALLSAIIKFKGRLTIQLRGKGKLQLLLAQCDDQNQLRGLAKYDDDINKEELLDSLKNGLLVMMLDSGSSGQRYQGIVEWTGTSIAESIEHYFKHSEQLDTRIWLSVNDRYAIGYLLQIIPLQEKHSVGLQEEVLTPSWQRIVGMTESNAISILNKFDYPDCITHLYPEETLRIFAGNKVRFHCGCTEKRSRDAIYVLGREEAEAELKDKQVIVVTCEFCNKEYVYDRVDVEQIFRSGDNTAPDNHLH